MSDGGIDAGWNDPERPQPWWLTPGDDGMLRGPDGQVYSIEDDGSVKGPFGQVYPIDDNGTIHGPDGRPIEVATPSALDGADPAAMPDLAERDA